MGYDEAEHGTVWALDFDDLYPGLAVRVRRPGFAAARMLARADRVLVDKSADPVRRLDAMAAVITAFADSMDSWTLTRNGRPVPTTRAAVLACDSLMLGRIVGAWRTHVIGAQARVQRQDEAAPAQAPAFDDRLLSDLPMTPLVDEDDVEAPEDRGVPLSLDPDVAAAQSEAWHASAEPADQPAAEPIVDDDTMRGPTLTAVG